MRNLFYLLGRLLGDVGAAKRGRLPRRVLRRITGRGLGRLMRRIFG